ncbi:serine/threonine protein kinase [Peribacillus kribbensis]|uniref:serine/threonine protein kinase n=1 Tax=Peribacillus kribbensis TaxID=356658 RepID=UPI00041C2069|nr:protein kinase [Peribacillus kribbensis]
MQPIHRSKLLLSFLPERMWEKKFIEGLRRNYSLSVQSILGTGSFGRAYLVQNERTKKLLVVKRLRKRKWRSREAWDAFAAEQRILQSINHPSFPHFVIKGEAAGLPFIGMEQKRGTSLEDLLFEENRKFSEEEAFLITCKVLRLAEALHKQGFVHRDIRIPNVLLDETEINLLDFGLGTEISPDPETGDAHPKLFKNHLSDLYGIGHLLLFLLYSGFEASKSAGRGWESELSIEPDSKKIIKRLLLGAPPFPSAADAAVCVEKHCVFLRGKRYGHIQ